ncbi:hypothetical protein ON010_g18445 [Phytophthora cinnamomi]|nr:hypothetical protein ON010_g18445 [Phytophthora cinnamomi]
MRFPLPVDTFPALKVSEDDEFEIGKLAEGYIHEALEEYMDFRIVNGGVLNKKRWKPIKTRKGVTAYRDLHMMDPESSRVASKAKVGSGAMTASTKLQGVLAVGTIDGEFNDMAFGLLNTNIEMLKIKSSYTNDKIADAKVLASIVEPTPTQPVRGTYIKWSVSTGVPLLLKKLLAAFTANSDDPRALGVPNRASERLDLPVVPPEIAGKGGALRERLRGRYGQHQPVRGSFRDGRRAHVVQEGCVLWADEEAQLASEDHEDGDPRPQQQRLRRLHQPRASTKIS